MNRKFILGSLAFGAIVAVWACGGSTANTTGGADAGGDGANSGSGSGGASGSGSGTNGSDSGSGSGGSSGGSSSGGGSGSSSGSTPSDAGVVVEGGAFPCGQGVCNPPDVCCETVGGGGGATTKCESASACKGVAESCTAVTCPSGAICCGTLAIGTAGVSGSTECVEGTTCPTGSDQLCTQTNQCPTGDTCEPLRMGGGGGMGGDGTEVCQKPIMRPDGGNFPPPKDAGGGD